MDDKWWILGSLGLGNDCPMLISNKAAKKEDSDWMRSVLLCLYFAITNAHCAHPWQHRQLVTGCSHCAAYVLLICKTESVMTETKLSQHLRCAILGTGEVCTSSDYTWFDAEGWTVKSMQVEGQTPRNSQSANKTRGLKAQMDTCAYRTGVLS